MTSGVFNIVRVLPVLDKLGFRLALMLAVALLPLMIVSIKQSQSVLTEAEARSQAALAGATLRAVSRELALIENAKGAANALSRVLPQLLSDPARCSQSMQAVLKDTPFSFAAFYDLNGDVPCSSSDEPISFGRNASLLEQIADPKPIVLVNQDGPASGTSVIYASTPVRGADAALIGFASISVPHLALRSPVRTTGAPAAFMTLNADGTILTAEIGLEAATRLLPVMSEKEMIADLPRGFTRVGRNGRTNIYAVVPVIEGELYALGTWPANSITGRTIDLQDPAVFSALMWFASLAVAWFASELFVTRHVLKLRESMRVFAQNRKIPVTAYFDRAPGEIRDVTRSFVDMAETILHDEAELEDVARQKDILLREVHHRVKNNLQLIASIMSMQMRQTRSPEVAQLLRSLQDRVNSLATIHKGLYQTTGQADVWIDELLETIVRQTIRLGTTDSIAIDLTTEISKLQLNPDQAVPLALLVTEALTNALKYIGAGTGSRPTLLVRLAALPGDQAEITIANSLPDVPVPPDADKSSGLGSELLEAFAMQLGGHLSKQQDADKFTLILRFPVEPLAAKT